MSIQISDLSQPPVAGPAPVAVPVQPAACPCGMVWGHHVWPGGRRQIVSHVLIAGAVGLGVYLLVRRRSRASVAGFAGMSRRRRRRRR